MVRAILKVVITSIIVLFCLGLFVVPSLLRCRGCGSNESPSVSNLRTVNTAEVTYLSNSGSYGSIRDLIAAGLLDDTFADIKAGYKYSITLDATGSVYTAEATPASAKTGR